MNRQVFAFVSDTCAVLECKTDNKSKHFRSHGDKEYDNAMLRSWFVTTGAVRKDTSRESPQQDGPGERLNRTLWDPVRLMMKESELPVVLYLSYAVQYATHVRNFTNLTFCWS